MKPLVITASGACTPVGTRAWLTACALNAHQSAFTRIQMPDHIDHRATVSPVSAIPTDESGTDRLLRLATPALIEALRASPAAWPLQRPLMAFIALPQLWPELPQHFDAERFQLELPRALDIAAEYLPMRLFVGGACAGADALSAAYRFMHANPKVDEVLVGGVDSLCDAPVARALYQRGWAKVNRHTEGFIGAEGAAFVRLGRDATSEEFATVYPPGIGQEDCARVGVEDLLSGKGLIDAVEQALQASAMPVDALHTYWSDLDGTPWRGSEAASLSAALAARGGLPPLRDPAGSLGQMGAAWVPLMLSLFLEMRQIHHHPMVPQSIAGHAALQSVTGLDERIAAWVCTWSRTSGVQTH